MMNDQNLRACYRVLVTYCGVRPDGEDAFVRSVADPRCTEYRFCGELGFGGKFWPNEGRPYVTCYPEDETPGRKRLIEWANRNLTAIADAAPPQPASDAEPHSDDSVDPGRSKRARGVSEGQESVSAKGRER